uniref:Uncharacterized protein n=1 Tax=Arion vulgaris TaxID=1028688 RepID=A0A0B7B379_9EUPU
MSLQSLVTNLFITLLICNRLLTLIHQSVHSVLVLDGGHVKEFDTPVKLLDDHNSIFYSMAVDANLV